MTPIPGRIAYLADVIRVPIGLQFTILRHPKCRARPALQGVLFRPQSPIVARPRQTQPQAGERELQVVILDRYRPWSCWPGPGLPVASGILHPKFRQHFWGMIVWI